MKIKIKRKGLLAVSKTKGKEKRKRKSKLQSAIETIRNARSKKLPSDSNVSSWVNVQSTLEVPDREVSSFLATANKLKEKKSPKAYYQFIEESYEEVFGSKPPNASYFLLEIAIRYQLLHNAYKQFHFEEKLTEKFLQNWKAAISLDLSKFHKGMKGLIESQIKTKPELRETVEMAKTKTKKGTPTTKKGKKDGRRGFPGFKGETTNLSIKDWYIKIYKENFKKKFTDEQIAKLQNKEFPSRKHSTVEVARWRNWFNSPAASGLKNEKKAPKFDNKGNAIIPKRGRPARDTSPTKPAKGKKGKAVKSSKAPTSKGKKLRIKRSK